MGEGFHYGFSRHTLLDKVICREKILIGLMRPTHAGVAARGEQPRVEHFPHIVVTRREFVKVPNFATAGEFGDRDIFARGCSLGAIPDRKAVTESSSDGDPAGQTQALPPVEPTMSARVTPAGVVFLAEREAASAIQIGGAGRQTSIALIKIDEYVQSQRLDGKGDGLRAEKFGNELFRVDAASFKRGFNVAPAQRRQFEHAEAGFAPDLCERASQGGCRPNRGSASDANEQAISGELPYFLGEAMGHRLDSQHGLVETVEQQV